MEKIELKSALRYLAVNTERAAFMIQLLCMFLFLYTAYSKIIDHTRFEAGLSRVELIGGSSTIISWLVPLSEIATAILLIIPKTSNIGLSVFAGLMILFSLYIVHELIWASRLPCHCGGIIESLSWRQHLWFNLGFVGIALVGLMLNRKSKN